MDKKQLDRYKSIAAFLFMVQLSGFMTLMLVMFNALVPRIGMLFAIVATAFVLYLSIRLIDSIIKKEYNVFWNKAMHNEQRKS